MTDGHHQLWWRGIQQGPRDVLWCECLNSKPRHHVLSLMQASISCLNVHYWEKETLLCQKPYSSILLRLGIIPSHLPILKIWVFPTSEWRTHPNIYLAPSSTALLLVPQRHVITKQPPSHHQPASIPCFRCNHGKVTFSLRSGKTSWAYVQHLCKKTTKLREQEEPNRGRYVLHKFTLITALLFWLLEIMQ